MKLTFKHVSHDQKTHGRRGGGGSGGGGANTPGITGGIMGAQSNVKLPSNAVMSRAGLSKTFSNNLIKHKNAGNTLSKLYKTGKNSFTDKAVKGKVVQIKTGDFKDAFVRIHGRSSSGPKGVTFEGSIINGKGRESWGDDVMIFEPSVFNG